MNNNDVEEEVEYYYDKKFTFDPPPGGWLLLPPEVMFTASEWKIPEMMKYKRELNEMKNKLNDFDLETWHKHTRSTNPAGIVIRYVKETIQPELLTQVALSCITRAFEIRQIPKLAEEAWCKFYELCSNYPLVPEVAVKEGFLNSVHLCEAPGAFVTALNHYLRLNYPNIQWEWIATTLNPHYEENQLSVMITDDRFLLLTLDRWTFGPDHTGNIMNLDNLKALVAESKKKGPILLVTADGSIDCQDQPEEQEELVAPLLFCQIVAGLHILSTGGTLLVKSFTMYEHQTICLMYLLNACFEKVHVYKPVTSKEGNSETYVVCVNYDGTNERKAWLRRLRLHYGPTLPTCAMFPLLKIPEIFIEQLLQCSELFKRYQEEVLERNIVLYNIDHQPSMKKIKAVRYRVAEVFIEKYRLRPLVNEEEDIVGRSKLERAQPLQVDKRQDDGTFNERRQRELLPPDERLVFLMRTLDRFQVKWKKGPIRWLQFPERSLHFKILRGKPVKTVRSSKFCSGNLLRVRCQVEALIKQIQGEMFGNRVECSKELSEGVKNAIAETCPDLLKSKCCVLNFEDTLWISHEGRNDEFERQAFEMLFEALDQAWRDVNFVIEGYPMLTQLSAGLIFMIAHLFEQVGFVKPQGGSSAVIFRCFRSRDRAMEAFMQSLINEAGHAPDATDSVLSIIAINQLVENNDFYESVVALNVLTLKDHLTKRIIKVLKA